MPQTSGRTLDVVRSAIAMVATDRMQDFDRLDPDVDLWSALDLDSLDHLTVMTALAEHLGADIPERDYPRLLSVRQLHDYMTAKHI